MVWAYTDPMGEFVLYILEAKREHPKNRVPRAPLNPHRNRSEPQIRGPDPTEPGYLFAGVRLATSIENQAVLLDDSKNTAFLPACPDLQCDLLKSQGHNHPEALPYLY